MTTGGQVSPWTGPKGRKALLERILIGVDFRQPSLAAARWATAHFGTCAQIELAHVLPIPEVPGFLRPMMPVLDDRLETASGSPLPGLRGFAATLGARDLSLQVRVGPPSKAWLTWPEASRQISWYWGARLWTGSRGRTLERLIRQLTVPALVIGGGTEERPRRILAAVDDAPIGGKVVDWAAALAQHFGAELTLLHVLSDTLLAHDWLWEESSRQESGCVRLGSSFRWVAPTHAWLRGLGPTGGQPSVARTIVAVGAAGPVILERARAVRADLIVVGRNGAHAIGAADIGSATRLALRGARVPVVVVPGTDALRPRHAASGVIRDAI